MIIKRVWLLSIVLGCAPIRESKIVTYPPIPGLSTSDVYVVKVNNRNVWTEKLRTNFDLEKLPDWFTGSPYVSQQQEVHISNFSCDGPLTVQLEISEPIDSASVHPLSRGIQSTIDGQSLTFFLPGPDKLYIQVNELPPLCFFANPLEKQVPHSTDPNVIWFGPGVHRPGMMVPESGSTIYIAGGAIVYGGIETDGQSDIRVLGRGILDGNFEYSRMVKPENSSNLEFNGIIIRNGRSWTNTIINCDSVVYQNIKVVSFRPGGDGINPLNSRHVKINECFLRCTDDCIAIKAPNPEIPSYDIRITNSTMVGFAYSDGCTIGFETNAPSISDILVKNSDIIQARGGSRVDGHSAFSIICDGPARIHDIHYEDIRVEDDVLKLFELHITDGTKYGVDTPGHIENVLLKNISWASKRPIILCGYDDEHTVKNVTFENCTVAGQPLLKAREDIFRINEFVRDVKFEHK
ncbi:hypothetical protein JXA70_10515 [candidate division KSB1 bacterium]|nr:hypothetical protein [candidate division KSB1 bacterium]